jgi:hypothetical protein
MIEVDRMRQSIVEADRVLLRMELRATVITDSEMIEDLAESIRPHKTWSSGVQAAWTHGLDVMCVSGAESFDVVSTGFLELAFAPGGRSRAAESTFDKARELLGLRSVRLPVPYTDLEELDRLIRSSRNAERRKGLEGAALWMPTLAEEANPPDVAVYWTNIEGNPESPLFKQPLVVIAIWESGKVIWSQEESTGGPPYLEASIDKGDVVNVLRELQRMSDEGLVPNPEPLKEGYPPYLKMVTSEKGGGIHLMSYREPFERQWAEIRRLLRSLIPREGTQKPEISFDWPPVFF